MACVWSRNMELKDFSKSEFLGTRVQKRTFVRMHAPNTSTPRATLATVPDIASGTYGGSNDLWLSQEAERLKTLEPNPGNGLLLTRGRWSWEIREKHHFRLRGELKFRNLSRTNELFVSEVASSVVLLGTASLAGMASTVQIIPRHPGGSPPPRPDGYWVGHITRAGEGTGMEVQIDLRAEGGGDLSTLRAVRLELEYVCYGPHGRTHHSQHVVLPLHFQPPLTAPLRWRKTESGSSVLPIPTHLLCHLDDPLQILHTYALPHLQPGDVVAVGETPLAIMQGRFRHPKGVKPSLVARLCCRPFHPTSSLATACGMQALVDVVGRMRVIAAVIGAILARVVGQRGMFYRLAGPQARLIDDVTGTLPPYDQFITLGPIRSQQTVDALAAKTGCQVAIVDVNDLRKVQILAASSGVDHSVVTAALRSNPAGNADEQTPIVLIRKGVAQQD